MLQLMCSWLSTSAEGKQALALPYVGGRLLIHAADIVTKLASQGLALPLEAFRNASVVPPNAPALGMLAILTMSKRRHLILNLTCAGSPAGSFGTSATPALIFCTACDLAMNVPPFLSEETVSAYACDVMIPHGTLLQAVQSLID